MHSILLNSDPTSECYAASTEVESSGNLVLDPDTFDAALAMTYSTSIKSPVTITFYPGQLLRANDPTRITNIDGVCNANNGPYTALSAA